MKKNSNIENEINPEAIINAWTAMEILSPVTFMKPEALVSGNKKDVIKIDNNQLPWDNGRKNFRKGYRVYYQIILGSINMMPAIDELLKVYADSREQRPQVRGEAVLAAALVDEKGYLIDANAVTVSSFAWGVQKALTGKLTALGEEWNEQEKIFTKGVEKILETNSYKENAKPLTIEKINQAFDYLCKMIGLNENLVNKPAFLLCTYQTNKIKNPPETMLLNSFFLKDLKWAKELCKNNKITDNLKTYLGVNPPKKRINLIDDNKAIKDILQPKNLPNASWPAKGRHPLVLLQQCAVNIISKDLKNNGVIAVNGPPGTGKTTLLRDIIADIITQRAEILATYDDPETAFKHSGVKVKRNQAFLHIYKLNEEIHGFEILVASSNNKAVENISIELPRKDSVADGIFSNGYFSTVAKNLWPNNPTWGVISAALGNGANRANFRQKFWWDKDFGLHGYLKHICGNFYSTENDDEEKIIPEIIQNEKPPENHAIALDNWEKIKKKFAKSKKHVEKQLDALQKICNIHDLICKKQEKIETQKKITDEIKNKIEIYEKDFLESNEKYAKKERDLSKAILNKEEINKLKPGFLNKIFYTKEYRNWKRKEKDIEKKYQEKQKEYDEEKEKKLNIENSLQNLEKEIKKEEEILNKYINEVENYTYAYKKIITKHEINPIDSEFKSKNGNEKQKISPWLDKKTATLRQNLFEDAINLHKAFIDAAAKPIRHNITLFLESFCTKSLGEEEADKLIKNLWATFFLIVPVVSTSFASVTSMLQSLKENELGWLLIDEAGQALPQATVGALLRCKRTVVVGDPLQIEPIVTLPEMLNIKICKEFGIDHNIYNAPDSSVQTLADKNTSYIGAFETKYGTREVGIPLLVHRRCDEPMFSIANSVAYENLMVQAKAKTESEIIKILGESRWININSNSANKWSEEEGIKTLELLKKIKEHKYQPEVYIITPFVEVQNSLKNLIKESQILENWVSEPYTWINEHVGTVHTVQGREAEAVIFVLGAPGEGQNGAREWAGKKPNLLNVAVTRAKKALYVIGNQNAWKNAGVFQELSILPVLDK